MSDSPVSRFWACFFSHSIFALFWTIKMEKVQRWILISILSTGSTYGGFFAYFVAVEFAEKSNVLYDMAFVFGMILFGMGISASIVLPIYFMYKWASEYNVENFGYESKIEWKMGSNTRDALG
ncbi:MAG: hypothetical protein D9C04_02245 [Nitrosopumilus sp. B06]|nr:MAG: hypothetical protein EB828_03325 [Nitrosopumilus sp. D6]RNJ80245.1 MAG: hypothetical protein D9C04_02245 [Nitrosopumilus sp. B06]